MIKFIKEALSESGSPSSKRISFFILLGAFLGECGYNIVTGKSLSPTLTDQLYYAMLLALGTIFGVNVLEKYRDIKVTQSNNNAQVGAPSPSPDTTIVATK